MGRPPLEDPEDRLARQRGAALHEARHASWIATRPSELLGVEPGPHREGAAANVAGMGEPVSAGLPIDAVHDSVLLEVSLAARRGKCAEIGGHRRAVG